jgi:hypothetical protein
MPIRIKCQQAAVVDIGVFSRSRSSIQNLMQNKESIDLGCSGNQLAMPIIEIETIVMDWFDFDVLVLDLRL